MARFELTMRGGDKVLIDHLSSGMDEMLGYLSRNPFVLFSEVNAATSAEPREVIIATGQIAAVRPLLPGATQGSNFRPKR